MAEIAILDFGSQYTHLIARRVRELGVVSHIYSNEVSAAELSDACGIILSGGPKSVLSDDRLMYDPKLFELGKPILGLCYGHQLIAQHFGGKVSKGVAREYGLATLNISHFPFLVSEGNEKREMGNGMTADIFYNIPSHTTVWMSHGDHVEVLPHGFHQIANTDNASIAAMANEDKKIYSFQFHPEVHHTKDGGTMLSNFIFRICGAKKNWTTGDMLAQIENEIKIQAGDKKVFMLMSGGVDSTVCFTLLEKTLGKDRVYGFHVDHGLMRKNESALVKEALSDIGLDNLHVYNAEDEFLSALATVTEPEEKRKIIGNLFLDITERAMQNLGFNDNEWLLGQGTIYPDTIESGGTKNADKIKTHHNRVDRVTQMIGKGLIIEPIKELYKDDVREIGRALGLPALLINRHPFPGPGLAIRCLCVEETTPLRPSCGRDTSPCKGEDIGGATNMSSPLQGEVHVSQAGETTEGYSRGVSFYKLPIRSVGVQGDERSYAHPAVVLTPITMQGVTHDSRKVRSTVAQRTPCGSCVTPLVSGGITHQINWPQLRATSPAITNTHRDINRVLITVAGDENKLIESNVHAATLTKPRLNLLREIDAIVTDYIMTHDSCRHIWQMPVVLIPFGYNHGESIVLRPVVSEEAMTVSWAELPDEFLNTVVPKIAKSFPIDFIFYDITNKPPGTIEWE